VKALPKQKLFKFQMSRTHSWPHKKNRWHGI